MRIVAGIFSGALLTCFAPLGYVLKTRPMNEELAYLTYDSQQNRLRAFATASKKAMLVIAGFFFGALLVYFVLLGYVLKTTPLDEELAYNALQNRLRVFATAGRNRLDLSPVTLLGRQNELIFFGTGSVRGANGEQAEMPILESIQFRYIIIMTRGCRWWVSSCYKADELELTGEKNLGPKI